MTRLCLVSGAWPSSLLDTVVGSCRVLAEDAAAAQCLKAHGVSEFEAVSEVVRSVPDTYDPSVIAGTRSLLPSLAAALGADCWSHRGVPLWDVLVVDFLWRCLDPVFQATDTAKRLFEAVEPVEVRLLGSTPLLRAAAAVASTRLSRSSIRHLTRESWSESRRHCAPYVGHIREWATGRVRSGRSSKGAVVVVCHTDRNLSIAAPVLEQLTQRVGSDRVIVLNPDRQPLRMHGREDRPQLELSAFTSLIGGLSALRAIAPVKRFLKSARWRDDFSRLQIEWGGVPLADVAGPEISSGLGRVLSNAVREIDAACNMLESIEPAAIILTDDRASFGRALGLAARVHSVPTVMMQWGPIGHNAVWIPGVAADVAVVEGALAQEVLSSGNNHAQLRIEVTGQPRYETLASRAKAVSRLDVCHELGLRADRPLILYASPPVVEASASSRLTPVEQDRLALEVKSVIEAALRLAPAQLVVKPHPNEGSDIHQEMASRVDAANVRVLGKDADIYPVLFVSDVVVTHHSTVGVEGIVLGKPLAIVNLTGRADAMPYVQSRVALGAYREADVCEVIRRALHDPSAREEMAAHRPAYLRRHASRGPTPAAERIAAIVIECLGGRSVSGTSSDARNRRYETSLSTSAIP